MISKKQKAIIRKICKAQEASLLRVVENSAEELYNQLKSEGYEITLTEVIAQFSEELLQWAKVKENPEKFLQHLDESNIGLIKHHLINSFEGRESARPIWYQLDLFNKVNQFRN